MAAFLKAGARRRSGLMMTAGMLYLGVGGRWGAAISSPLLDRPGPCAVEVASRLCETSCARY